MGCFRQGCLCDAHVVVGSVNPRSCALLYTRSGRTGVYTACNTFVTTCLNRLHSPRSVHIRPWAWVCTQRTRHEPMHRWGATRDDLADPIPEEGLPVGTDSLETSEVISPVSSPKQDSRSNLHVCVVQAVSVTLCLMGNSRSLVHALLSRRDDHLDWHCSICDCSGHV